jgi:hypothetical protein
MDRLEHAKNLLNDELFVEAFDVTRQELLNRWEHSNAEDPQARESIWLALQILSRIRIHIESVMTTDELAKAMDAQSPFI